jgi:hypothetical protein
MRQPSPLFMVFTNNLSDDMPFHIVALEGYCEVTVSLNTHAMNFKTNGRYYLQIIFISEGQVRSNN